MKVFQDVARQSLECLKSTAGIPFLPEFNAWNRGFQLVLEKYIHETNEESMLEIYAGFINK